MKSKVYVRTGVIYLIGLFAGCSLFTSSPSSIARKYLVDGVKDGNANMQSLFTQNRVSKAGVNKIRDLTRAMHVNFHEVTSIKIAKENVTGNMAEVDAEVTQDIAERPTTFTFTLVKEGGEWKIDQINFGKYQQL